MDVCILTPHHIFDAPAPSVRGSPRFISHVAIYAHGRRGLVLGRARRAYQLRRFSVAKGFALLRCLPNQPSKCRPGLTVLLLLREGQHKHHDRCPEHGVEHVHVHLSERHGLVQFGTSNGRICSATDPRATGPAETPGRERAAERYAPTRSS